MLSQRFAFVRILFNILHLSEFQVAAAYRLENSSTIYIAMEEHFQAAKREELTDDISRKTNNPIGVVRNAIPIVPPRLGGWGSGDSGPTQPAIRIKSNRKQILSFAPNHLKTRKIY